MVTIARDAGCPRDQLRNFLAAGCVPLPKQFTFHAAARACDRDGGPTKIGFGGARGPGKSHGMLSQMAVDDCQRLPGLKCLLLRKVGKAAKEGFEDLRVKVLRRVPHKYNRQEGILYFPNGSRIVLGHFQNESDIDSYLGLEYDVIGTEEATTLSARKDKAVGTCLRTSKPNWRPRRYYTTNPGNIGHAWFKKLFIEPYRKGQECDTRFVPATVEDNPLVNAEYRGELDTLIGWELRAWRFGDWDIAAGQFFTNWREDVHVSQKPLEIQLGWYVWLAMDYGWVHWNPVYLMAETGDGDILVVDEHAQRGWLPERHDVAIRAMLARHQVTPEQVKNFVAGADVFSRDDEGKTTADKYLQLGWRLSRANADRVNGASEVLHRLGDVSAEQPIRPSLRISPRCSRLIECLPALQHDPHRGEDVLKVDCGEDGEGGDDFYDALRYGCMARRLARGTITNDALAAMAGFGSGEELY